MCLHSRSTFWCGCTIDMPEPDEECNNRGHCIPEYMPEKIEDMCPECDEPANESVSDISITSWNADSDANMHGSDDDNNNNNNNNAGPVPELAKGNGAHQEPPLTIDPNVLHHQPRPPNSVTGVPNIAQTARQVFVDPLFNTVDFSQGGPVNPPRQLAQPFQDANGVTFYEGPHVFIPSNYGSHSIDVELPSVGETPFNPTDMELERMEQSVLDSVFSFFPAIPDIAPELLPTGISATENQALTGPNEAAMAAVDNNRESPFEWSLFSDTHPDTLGVNAVPDTQALLSPNPSKNQQESSQTSTVPTTGVLHENRPADIGSLVPDQNQQDTQSSVVAYPPTPSADLEYTREEHDTTVRSRSSKSPADESMADVADASNTDGSQRQPSQSQHTEQPLSFQPTPGPEQQQQTPVTGTEVEEHAQPQDKKRRASGPAAPRAGRRKRKGPRLTLRKYAWRRSGDRRSDTQELEEQQPE